jgi:hypothetical protein
MEEMVKTDKLVPMEVMERMELKVLRGRVMEVVVLLVVEMPAVLEVLEEMGRLV